MNVTNIRNEYETDELIRFRLFVRKRDYNPAVVTTSSLSFLGFGIQPPAPDWGVMVFEARRFLFDRPDILLYPAAAIVITVISLNVLTDSLLRLLDPTARGMLA